MLNLRNAPPLINFYDKAVMPKQGACEMARWIIPAHNATKHASSQGFLSEKLLNRFDPEIRDILKVGIPAAIEHKEDPSLNTKSAIISASMHVLKALPLCKNGDDAQCQLHETVRAVDNIARKQFEKHSEVFKKAGFLESGLQVGFMSPHGYSSDVAVDNFGIYRKHLVVFSRHGALGIITLPDSKKFAALLESDRELRDQLEARLENEPNRFTIWDRKIEGDSTSVIRQLKDGSFVKGENGGDLIHHLLHGFRVSIKDLISTETSKILDHKVGVYGVDFLGRHPTSAVSGHSLNDYFRLTAYGLVRN